MSVRMVKSVTLKKGGPKRTLAYNAFLGHGLEAGRRYRSPVQASTSFGRSFKRLFVGRVGSKNHPIIRQATGSYRAGTTIFTGSDWIKFV